MSEKAKKQTKEREVNKVKRMLGKNKRNHINSTCCNNCSINYISYNKY